ncbi:Nup93/Nic96-domain-containing protein [Xylaria bambusicola]|uniref:Nup93/Nic96-domain-containing protein n=1 Tax=Xylaria bambusicola TaxID=326684 RepID=UPI00200823B0|nr:Nup93/Nic96-domain-containing protein [Xylaria bambusicola]KAI0518425.1 Nup93/Nic96-domain-containing protein [Xylaria bambusicola]
MASQDHYIGIDVGTGSARACLIDSSGDIRALASEAIKLWQPQTGYYEQSTTDIWHCICHCVQRVVHQSGVDPSLIKGIGFDATCSLAVFAHDTDEPVPVTGPDFENDGNDRNVILWLDHRPVEETEKINATGHNLLRYVGGKMSIEMEIPKVLWLKNNMPPELFSRCKFYDLADALTHLATGNETRSFCSTVCKQGYVPVGVDGSVKGWQEDFYHTIGLSDLVEDNFKRMGGVDGVNGKYMSAGELVGTLSEHASKQLGIPAGIAVGSGVIDAYAGWIGTVGAKVDTQYGHADETHPANDLAQASTRLAAVAGTSTCHLALSEKPVFVNGVWGPYRDVLLPGFWLAEGGQSATGELLRHVIETHPAHKDVIPLAEATQMNVYDYLNVHLRELAEKAEAPTVSYLGRHFFFYGDLWGNRSPVADPNMKGAVIGLSSDSSVDGLALYYYATMEFIALQTRQIVEAMNKEGHNIQTIFMSGSQCQNEMLMNLIATCCDMPVLIPRYVHAAVVHGAAMLGAKAASADSEGATENLWSIMDRMSKPGRLVKPGKNANEKKLLDTKYEVFLDQCRTQQDYRKKVDEATTSWAILHPPSSIPSPSMSLFGASTAQQQQPQQNAAPRLSLFGQQPSGQRPNLFASSTAQNQTQNTTPSLFNTGSQQPQTSQTQNATPSLFNTGSQQPQTSQTPSLFANSTATQQPQAQSGSLFGNQTAQPAATGTAGGLFGSTLGNTAQQQQPQTQGPGLFGLGAPTSNQNAGTSSLFGASQQPTASTNNGALPQGNTTGYFDSLLAKSKKQAQGESPLEDLPSLQLGLGDLRQRLRKLGPQVDPLQHGRAQYMLAASGVDPGAAVKDLKYFSASTAGRVDRPTTASAAPEVDVEAYLANLQSKTTLSMIADGLERSTRDFDNFLEDNITMEWEAQRKRIYEHFGIKPREDGSGEHNAGTPGRETSGGFGRSRRNPKASRAAASTMKGSAFGRSAMQKSVIGTPTRIGLHQPEFKDVEDAAGSPAVGPNGTSTEDRLIREKQAKLAERVRDLNLARLEKTPYAIFNEFAQVESRTGDRHAQQLVDAYNAAMFIVGENPEAETFAGDATARERQFKDSYLDLNEKSAASLQMRRRILDGANRFLERKFFQEVESVIAKHPREAALGGRPDVISKIQAYVRLRNARRDLVPDNIELQQDAEGEFVWAIVFFLLRSGHVDEAAHYIKAQATVFRTIDRTFASYLLEYVGSPERRLRRQLQDRCNNEYNQRVRNAPENSIDPYRMACYKIIGRCDVSNRSLDNLNTEIDDWVWLQFNLARENDKSTEVATESYGLQDLRTSIREIGLKHFPKNPTEDTNGTFGMFFYLQILAGMFEQAISYLYTFSYVDAIHFAIGLEYYGLLRPADPWNTSDTLLSYDTRSKPQLSFGRMLGYYTRDFRAADVNSAVDYLTLICLNADLEGEQGRQQAELCHVALRELVLETREFSKLIGDIRPDGRRITGLIEERGPLIGLQEEDDFVRTVTLQAARFADDNGRTTDAVLLYHLAGDYDSVVTIVSRALSEAISLEIGEDPMRLVPVKPRASGEKPEAQPGSSLSLASLDDPIQLAYTMMSMYEKDAMFSTKIQNQNRIACHLLLQMSEIKNLVEVGQWPDALDKIRALEILPLDAGGDPTRVRHYASKFSGLSQAVAINVPNLLMWSITCCIRQRERLMSAQFSGNEGSRRAMCDNLKQISIDLTTYTSQLRYRFPPHLLEALARASAD